MGRMARVITQEKRERDRLPYCKHCIQYSDRHQTILILLTACLHMPLHEHYCRLT